MGKRTIGIFSNYDASEKTFCALYLAEHVIGRYRHVAWVTPSKPFYGGKYYGFSHKWDTQILSLKSELEQIKNQLMNCEICFFFEENEQLYSFLSKETKTIFFLDPHTWTDQSRAFASKCDYSFAAGRRTISLKCFSICNRCGYQGNPKSPGNI